MYISEVMITHFLTFFIFSSLNLKYLKIYQNGCKPFCYETLHILSAVFPFVWLSSKAYTILFLHDLYRHDGNNLLKYIEV